MSYTISVDGASLYNETDRILIDPALVQDVGSAETFDFSIPASHPTTITPYKSTITIDDGDEVIFYGRAEPPTTDIYKVRKYHAAGALSFLTDVPLPAGALPTHSGSTIDTRTYVTDVVNFYNSVVPADRQFSIAALPSAGVGTRPVGEREWKGQTCFEALKQECNDFGLTMFTRYSSGTLGLRLVDFGSYVSGLTPGDQPIRLGLNMLSFSRTPETPYSCAVAVGAGGIYEIVHMTTLENTYGVRCKYLEYPSISSSSTLRSTAQMWLLTQSVGQAVIDSSAVDLSHVSAEYGSFELARVVSLDGTPWGLSSDIQLPISRIETDLTTGVKKITLGIRTEGIFLPLSWHYATRK